MFTRLAHICLNVRNLQRSVDFYTKLGMKTSFGFTRHGNNYGAYLEIAPDQYVEMFEDPGFMAPQTPGIAHFCLEVADIDALIAELAKRQIPHTAKKLGCDQTWQIWLKDPDGHAFEVHQYTPQSAQMLGGSIETDW